MKSYVTKLKGKKLRFLNPDNLILSIDEYEVLAGYVMKTEDKMEVASTMAGLKTSSTIQVTIEATERDDSGNIDLDHLTLDILYVPDTVVERKALDIEDKIKDMTSEIKDRLGRTNGNN